MPWQNGSGGSASSVAGGAAGQDPTAMNLVSLPANEMAPMNTPAAWGLTPADLSSPLFASSTPYQVTSRLKANQIIGAIADKLGVKAKKGQSLQEQVIQALAKREGIQTSGPQGMANRTAKTALGTLASPEAVGGAKSDQDLMYEISQKMGLGTHLMGPVKGNPKASLDNPVTLAALADRLGVNTDPSSTQQHVQTTTVGQAAMQIYGMNSDQIASLQAQLWEGGFYDENVEGVGGSAGPDAHKLTPGNLDPYTMKAFGTMLSQLAGSKQKVSWTDFLSKQATTNAQGLQPGQKSASINDLASGNASGLITKSTPSVTLATSDQLLSAVQTAFENKLGRLPTQAELQQFTQQYDTQQEDHSKYLDPNAAISLPTDFTDTGAVLVPGVARPAAGAQAYAQSDQKEYLGHQIGNAGALMLEAMASAGGGLTAGNANQTTAP